MRKWLALLVFVPELAWGECGSPEMRQAVANLSDSLQERKDEGENYRQAMQRVASSGGTDFEQRLFYTIVDGVYGESSMQVIWQTTYAECVMASRSSSDAR